MKGKLWVHAGSHFGAQACVREASSGLTPLAVVEHDPRDVAQGFLNSAVEVSEADVLEARWHHSHAVSDSARTCAVPKGNLQVIDFCYNSLGSFFALWTWFCI